MRELITIIAPDGQEIPTRFEGWQWLGGPYGVQPQLTPIQPAPPVTHITNSTTYGIALRDAGYRLPPLGEPPPLSEHDSRFILDPI